MSTSPEQTEPSEPEQPGQDTPGQDPAWYKIAHTVGPIAATEVTPPQPPPRKWYHFPPWGPGWPHVVAALSLATAALGFSIAAFSMALVALIGLHS